jgi:hypothetical protein
MERVAHHEDGRAIDSVTEAHRVGDGHTDVVLIAVKRLDKDARSGALGALGERP